MIERIILYFIQVELFLIHKLLPAKLAFKLTRGLMKSFYVIIPRSIKKDITKNLQMVYGLADKEAKKARRKFIRKMLGYIGEVIAMPYVDKKYCDSNISFHYYELLNQALKRGKGVIILLIHAGNWELFGRALTLKGVEPNMIVKVPEKSALLKYIDDNRVKMGGKTTNVLKQNMFTEAIRSLKNNDPVIMLADTGALDSKHHEYVDFMGANVPLATAWITMAKKADTMVIPVTIHNDQGRHHIEFVRSIEAAKTDNLLQIVKQDFEKHLRKHYLEWFLPLDTYQVRKSFNKN